MNPRAIGVAATALPAGVAAQPVNFDSDPVGAAPSGFGAWCGCELALKDKAGHA